MKEEHLAGWVCLGMVVNIFGIAMCATFFSRPGDLAAFEALGILVALGLLDWFGFRLAVKRARQP